MKNLKFYIVICAVILTFITSSYELSGQYDNSDWTVEYDDCLGKVTVRMLVARDESNINDAAFHDWLSIGELSYLDAQGDPQIFFLWELADGGKPVREVVYNTFDAICQVTPASCPNGIPGVSYETELPDLATVVPTGIGTLFAYRIKKGIATYPETTVTFESDPTEAHLQYAIITFYNLPNELFGQLTKLRLEGFWDSRYNSGLAGGDEGEDLDLFANPLDQNATNTENTSTNRQLEIERPAVIQNGDLPNCTAIHLKWDVPTNVEDVCTALASTINKRFRIYRSVNGGAFSFLDWATDSGTFTDNNVALGVTYRYEVESAWILEGPPHWSGTPGLFGLPVRASYSDRSPAFTASLNASPDPPQTVKASNSGCSVDNDNIDLTWVNLGTPDSLLIERAKNIAFTDELDSFKISGNLSSYPDETAVAGELYYYRIRSINGCGLIGDASDYDDGFIEDVPSPPTGVVVAPDNSNIKITWKDMSSNETGFKLIRTIPGETGETIIPIDQPDVEFKVDMDVNICKRYHYKVQVVTACQPDGVGTANGETFVSPNLTGTFDITGANIFRATKGTFSDKIELTWTNNKIADTERIRIERRQLGSGLPFSIIATEPSDAGNYTDFSIQAGTLYEYNIYAEADCATAGTIPSPPVQSIGFRRRTGLVTGKVSYNNGSPVEGVRIGANDASNSSYPSIHFNGASNAIVPHKSNLNMTDAMVVESWLHPDNTTSNYSILSKSGEYELGYATTNAGEYYFSITDAAMTTHTVSVSKDSLENTDWNHIAGCLRNDSLLLYIGGKVKAINPINSTISLNNTSNALFIGLSYSGFMKELRIWDDSKLDLQVFQDHSRFLAGNEAHLKMYLNMGENIGQYAYDFSKNGTLHNENHALLSHANLWDDTESPDAETQLSIAAYTDSLGNYNLVVPYSGNGQSFVLVPIFGNHSFDPGTRSLFIGDGGTVLNNIDFEDISSFEFKGNLYYEGTTCPVKDAQLYVDGVPQTLAGGLPVQTDAMGRFNVAVPIGNHYVEIKKPNHTFSNNRWPETGIENFQEDKSGIPFFDNTKITLVGRAVGGDVESSKKPGMELSTNNIGKVSITLTREDNCGWDNGMRSDTTIVTDSLHGEYAIDLPPWEFSITENIIVETGETVIPEMELFPVDLRQEALSGLFLPLTTERDTTYIPGTTTISSTDSILYHKEYNFIKYNPAQVDVVDQNGDPFRGEDMVSFEHSKYPNASLDLGMDSLLFPVFITGTVYNAEIHAFESYKNADNGLEDRVPVIEGLLRVENELATQDLYEMDLATDQSLMGMIPYSFTAKGPNLNFEANSPAYSFTRVFKITIVKSPTVENLWQPFKYALDLVPPLYARSFYRGYIFGGRALAGTNHVVEGPETVDYILRDPPGGSSYSQLDIGSTIAKKETWSVGGGIDASLDKAIFQGTQFTVGLGYEVATEVKNEAALNTLVETSVSSENETTTTITTNEIWTTSPNPNNVFDGSDLFIGTSHNYNFGLSERLGVFTTAACNDNVNIECFGDTFGGFKIGKTKQFYIAPDKIRTSFSLTAKDIINYEIPYLIDLRNSLLGDCEKYCSKLPEDHPNFGKNNDDIAFGADTTQTSDPSDNPPSYTWISHPDSIDLVRSFNQQVRIWEETLAMNEEDKARASKEILTFTFDGGGSSFERSVTTDTTTSTGHSWEANLTETAKLKISADLAGNGAEVEQSIAVKFTSSGVKSTEESYPTTVSYSISDEDIWDRMGLTVYESPMGFGPIFRINSGATSCPHEDALISQYYQPGTVLSTGTVQLEQPRLRVTDNRKINIPEDGTAEFFFEMFNDSPETWVYSLGLLNHTNPGGAIVVNSGTSELGSQFTIEAGGVATQQILIEKGGAYQHDDLLFVLASTCQYDQGNDFDKDIADTAYVTAHFVPECTDISIAKPQDNWILNNSFDNELIIQMDGYDYNNPNLEKFTLYYRPLNDAIWKPLHEYYKDPGDAIGPNASMIDQNAISTTYTWDTSPRVDGNYELQVVSDCEIATKESEVSGGYIDRQNLEVFGTPSPGDGILGPNDDILLSMNETIDFGAVGDLNFDIRAVLNGGPLRQTESLLFDGQNDYGEIPEYQLQKRSFTIEFSLRRIGTGEEVILSQGNNTSTEQLKVGFNSSNQLYLNLGNGHIASNKSITNDGLWHHCAISYSYEDHEAYFYVDLAESGGSSTFNAIYDADGPIFIAKDGVDTLASRFAGNIQELRLWGKSLTLNDLGAKDDVILSGREAGLIGNWPMNEAYGMIARDKVRSRHMIFSGANWDIYPQSHSYEFDSTFLRVDNAGLLGYSNESDITIEAWFKTAGNGQNMSILSNGVSQVNEEAWDIYIDPLGQLVISSNGYDIIVDKKLDNDNWNHISIVLERTKAISIYINGELVKTENSVVFDNFAGPKLYIGARGFVLNGNDKIDNYFEGNIDDIRLWNVARRPEQVGRDFINQLNGDELGLIAYYPFDEYSLVGGVLNATLLDQSDSVVQTDVFFNLKAFGKNGGFSEIVPTIKLPRPVVNVDFDYSINNDQIFIDLVNPAVQLENVTVDITVENLRDLAGNYMISPETWIAYIDKNQVFWEEEYFQFEKKLEDNLSFKAKIKNTGGSQENYNLSNLPSWLSASPSFGIIEPNSTIEVTFTVQPLLNIGEYEQDIFVSTESFGFNERLLLDLKVVVDPPEWVIDQDDFSNSMNITGQLIINDVISTDPEDMVSVWVNDSLRGVSHVEYDPSSGKNLVFLTILSDSASMDALVFKAWDASRGRLLVDLEPTDFVYTNNQILGSRTNPIDIKGTVLTELTYRMNRGWNWISFPLASQVLTNANLALIELSPSDQDKLVYPGREYTYSGDSWRGTDTLTTSRGYKIKLAKADTFRYEGTFIDPSTEPIDIVAGWNWIGVKSEFIIDVPSAMASLDPKTGDVIKGQRSFAIYEDGFGWGGNLDFLKPQAGYMLKYHRADTLIYPGNLNARTRPETRLKSRSQRGKEYARLEKSLNYEDGKYSNTMSLIAEIDACIAFNSGDTELDLSQWSLAAHSGDECRGVVESTWQSSTGKYVYYLSIEGSSIVDLNFQLVHNTNGMAISLSQTMQFASNGVVGMNSTPYQFTCEGTSDCLESSLFQSGDIDMSQSEMTQHVMTDLRSDAILPSDRLYRFKAGNSIELILGFEVLDGATLEAYIEDCITNKQ